MKSPLTFTMAMWSLVDAGNGDQRVTVPLTRLVAYGDAILGQELPPSFFRAVHRIGEANSRNGEVTH